MPDAGQPALSFGAALVAAATPAPGVFHVAARALAGGRGEGVASSLGTGLGGLFHVAAGASGILALVMAGADAFALQKLVGATHLLWIGLKTVREARVAAPTGVAATGSGRAFRRRGRRSTKPDTAAFWPSRSSCCSGRCRSR